MIFFLTAEQVIKIHVFQLNEHGGLPGYRDIGAIDGMVMRVQNIHLYENESDLFVLAAAYLLAIARGHAFNDANKRTALLSALVFLDMNDITVIAPIGFADFIVEAAQGIHDVHAVASKLRQLA